MIRIARLDLERWGHFDDRTLTFGPSGSLHLVYGPNEAGKSTTRRAVSALLFGVPARTRDTYGRPGADLRIGALLELGDRTLEVTRRKGNKNTLLDNNGDALDEAALRAALGGLTSEVHAGLFEITHESLVQGGEELLAGHGAVGEALFAAAAGTARLHRLLKHLESESETLFSTRPSKKELNLLLNRHAEVTRALRDASLRPPRYEALQRELSELTAALASATATLETSQREHSRLERLRNAQPFAARRATRIAELAALGDVPALSADAPDRRIAATNRRSAAAASAAATTRELARARARTSELSVDDAFLAAASSLERLAATASSIESETARRSSLATELTTLQASLADRLAALAPGLATPDASRLTLDADARDRLEAHLQTRAGVQQATTSARAAVEDAQRAAQRAARDAASAPAATDDSMLTAALRGARRAGDVDEEIARARADERAAHAAADRTAGGDAEALAAIPVPDRETIEQLLGDVVEAERVRSALETEADAIAETIRRLEAQRDDLGAEAPVLDASALEAARTAREATWSKVREALVSEEPVADVEQLAVEHELTTTEADDVADERLRHAEDVTRLADIERNLVKLARDTTDLEARRERHAAAIDRATAAWTSAWSAAGGAAPSPASAGTFLSRRETTLTHLRTATDAATRAAAATHLRTEHTTSLRTALAATAPSASDDATPSPTSASSGDVPLATLIELAETRLESLRADADRATRAAEAVARTASVLEDAQADATRAEAALTAWTSEWTTLRDGCGLAESLAPDDALTTLRTLEQAARDQDRAASLTEELATLDAAREAFATDVATHVAQLTPDLADRPAPAAAQELHRRATAARAAAAERDALATAIADLERDEAEHQAVVAEADEELAALRATAGAADDAELIQHEQRAARAEALRQEIAALDGDLARAGGQPADQVAAAVAGLDADDAAVQADELSSRIARERDARDEAAAAVTRAQDELARLERSDEAAALRQESATLEAEIRAVAERYARARLAQKVLRDAIASYRSAHEGPLLMRANELFPALTCERFARLETDVDDRDEDVLIAITADGSRRRVEELSDGTREQLFLALRLAAIERHVTTSEPVPVLFDDVLLESDDDRARRILTALASLAASTQVIVLTHHRHLISLAAATIPSSSLDLITLTTATDSAPPAIAPAEPEPIASAPTPPLAAEPERAPEPIAAEADADDVTADDSGADDSARTLEPVASAAEDDEAPADLPAEDAGTPTLAEELAALSGHAVHESPYGEQTSLL